MKQTHHRSCHLCEAICGLVIETSGEQIVSIKGDKDDVFSKGYICPKAVALQDIHTDPDRVTEPMRKTAAGWQPISWTEAIQLAAEKLCQVQSSFGDDAVGIYAGNPSIHSYGIWLYSGHTTRALKTKNRYSATSVDQLPHHVVALLSFGHWLRIPVVDIDRCQWLLMLGANPLASNGSVMTAPDMPNRLKRLKARGGKLVVVDPRRTETAKIADQYLAMPPGKDVYLLLAMLQHLLAQGWQKLGRFEGLVDGLAQVAEAVAAITPELAEQQTGISAQTIKQLTAELVAEPKAAVYGRMGVSTQEHGSLCQWAIQLLNLLTGHVDEVGGLMLSNPAIDPAGPGSNPQGFDRHRSRVRGLPEFAGEYPSATLAEEILTPGAGQIKALLTIAGNPVLSTPNGRQLDQALGQLDFMVAIDFYINETTRHADLILPPVSPLERGHYDYIFHALGVYNTSRFSAPIFAKPAKGKHDWEIFVELGDAIRTLKGLPSKPTISPEQALDMMLQQGAHKLDLATLEQHPSGVDLGPHLPRMAALYSEDNPVRLAPGQFIQAVRDLKLELPDDNTLTLIGRRHMRSNNSWMHNYHRLVKGKRRDHLLMHPSDMQARNIAAEAKVVIKSRVGSVTAIAQVCEELLPGVVSLPHGFGHNRLATKLHIAEQHAGVSANDLTDDQYIDTISGNAAVNGVKVEVCAVKSAPKSKTPEPCTVELSD
ncbi:molybdopterin-dependent oxidoreductase [Simiduia curdlanivorans]|uniref:Molybdopterin-dependent oxidoreductase n=1 Tax=Simiduia curdlanivorans TaxID=1492769 RepID=A0ABV8UZP5_9GAMM|nr:molybdopterin-dependent oxidoreductase [Simiduia curdlanivorans]MDN3638069.1 molybdopterin-dependent oxidoreductase [Simiduia curdlanivorans]